MWPVFTRISASPVSGFPDTVSFAEAEGNGYFLEAPIKVSEQRHMYYLNVVFVGNVGETPSMLLAFILQISGHCFIKLLDN